MPAHLPTAQQACAPGWQWFNNYCYQIPSQVMNQSAAQGYCRSITNRRGLPGSLATIRSRYDNFFITSLMYSQNPVQRAYFIGLNDRNSEGKKLLWLIHDLFPGVIAVGSFALIFGSAAQVWLKSRSLFCLFLCGFAVLLWSGTYSWVSGLPVTYSYWAPNEPNNWRTGEDCVEIYSKNSRWNDRACNWTLPFICMMPDGQYICSVSSVPFAHGASYHWYYWVAESALGGQETARSFLWWEIIFWTAVCFLCPMILLLIPPIQMYQQCCCSCYVC